MKKIIEILDKDQINQGVRLILLMLLASIVEIFGLGLVLIIVNSILDIDQNIFIQKYFIDYFLILGSENFIINILLFLVILFTIKILILVYVSWKENYFLAELRKKISTDLFKNFIYRSPENVSKKNSAEYLRNFVEEINASTVFYLNFFKLILDTFLFVNFAIFLILFETSLSLIVISIFSFIGLIYFYLLKNKISNWAKEGLINKKKRIQFINESFSAIKYIKILSAENFFLKKFKLQNDSLSEIIKKQSFANSVPRNLFEYVLFISIIGILFLFINLNYSNIFIVQKLSIFTLVAFRIVPIIHRIINSSQNVRFTYHSLEKIYFELKQKSFSRVKNIKKFNFKKNIELKFNKFFYKKNKDNIILNKVKISFAKFSKIGIIGPSGSGKSTIVDMICGFIASKNKKMVTVDGKSIFENLTGWQKLIGYIPQNIVILNTSLRENILFGSSSNIYPDKKIFEILKKVELQKLIKKSKLKLSQPISQEGTNISGGEKQRIGIARALLRNPEVIIFDEATSGLDTKTEKKILNILRKLKKTIIFISHRVNSLDFCDKIFSIEGNKVKTINMKKTYRGKI